MKLARILQNGMVLQQGKEVSVSGMAQPGTFITASVQGRKAQTESESDGSFLLRLPPLDYSSDETLTISDGTEEISLAHVAVGEVWIAGGQSNMEFWMRYEKHLKEVKPFCHNPDIRFYETPKLSFDMQEEYFDYSRQGLWRQADPEQIDYFSAVGYFFAAELWASLRVPVGIIGCNYGGTTASAWMPMESVSEVGKAWMKDYEQAFGKLNMDEYWEHQRSNPGNDTGNPFANEFNNRFLPDTPSVEEAYQFFIRMSQEGSNFPAFQDPSSVLIPGCLYEHMLKPLAPFTVRGVLWYQGESDEPHADLYGIMLTRLIRDWRQLFAEELPFLLVQLPGFRSWMGREQTAYNELRARQKAVADAVRAVWMTSVSDVGEEWDIHPKDKQTPGLRLALLALGKIYGRDVLCEAPEPDSASYRERILTVHFRNAPGGLKIKGESGLPLSVDGTESCSAAVDGENLVITLPEKPHGAVTLRFAQEPFYLVGLTNAAGIPAIPFVMKVLEYGTP